MDASASTVFGLEATGPGDGSARQANNRRLVHTIRSSGQTSKGQVPPREEQFWNAPFFSVPVVIKVWVGKQVTDQRRLCAASATVAALPPLQQHTAAAKIRQE